MAVTLRHTHELLTGWLCSIDHRVMCTEVRGAQKDRGCIVCHGMKSVRPRNGAIPFSARTVGRVEGAPRDMARQPCVQGAVQLSTRATRLLLCGTR